MKRFAVVLLFLGLLTIDNIGAIPSWTSQVSGYKNGTYAYLRVHAQSINNGYSLYELRLTMTADRCALSNSIKVSIYEDDGAGLFGTLRDSYTLYPGSGVSSYSHTKTDRILIKSSFSTEKLYAKIEVDGITFLQNFKFETSKVSTTVYSDDSFENNDSQSAYKNLTEFTSYSGLICKDEDWYRVAVSSSKPRLRISMKYWDDNYNSSARQNLNLYVYNSSGSLVASSTKSSTSYSSKIEESIDKELPSGYYYVRVYPYNGAINFYDFQWYRDKPDCTPPGSFSLTSYTASCTYVRIDWSTSSNATSYDVYRNSSKIASTANRYYVDYNASTSNNTYQIYARNACGNKWSNNSYVLKRNSTPSTPSGVSATDGTLCNQVRVTWSAASGATSYDVYRNSSYLGNTSSLSYYDNNSSSSAQTYKVYAKNSCGTSGGYGYNTGYEKTVPAAVSSVTASDGTYCDRVYISWSSSSGATSYDVYRGSTKITNVSSTAYSDYSASTSNTSYTIYARNSCGISSKYTDFGYRKSVPSAVSNLTASDGTYCDRVLISWSASSGASQYEVYRGSTKMTTTSSTSFSDYSASTSSTTYTVYAINSCGKSSSTFNTGYRNAVPAAVSNLTASDGNYCDRVLISWSTSSRATQYEVYRGSTKMTTTSSTSYSDYSASSSSTTYTVYAINSCGKSSSTFNTGYKNSPPTSTPSVAASDGTYCDRVLISWGSVNKATSYDVYRGSTKISNTTSTSYSYYSASTAATEYRVKAVNSCGSSGYGSNTGYRKAAPGIPQNVSASDGTYCDKVVISWSSTSGATSYDVYHGSTKLGNTSSTSYTDASAPTSSTQYKVYAKNTCGSSSAGTNNGYRDSGPDTPGNVNATDATYCDKVVISWSTTSGASSYDVYRGTTKLGNTSSTSYTDNSAPTSSTQYKVYAINSCGSSSAGTDNGYRNAAPNTPSSVSATDKTYCDKVVITWNAASRATSYDVYRGSTKLGNTSSNSYTDSNAPSSSTQYKVYAVNSCGNSSAGTDNGYTDSQPSGTPVVNATDGTYCDKVVISWGGINRATSYDVYRGSTKLGNTTGTSYTDNSAPSSATQYKVYARNKCGSSSAGTDNGYRNTTPATPGSVNASDGTYCDKVVIIWSTTSGATSYDVYRGSTKLGNTSSTSYTDVSAPTSSTQYKVYAINSCGSSSAGTNNGYRDSGPDTPGNVNATDATYCDKVVISWSTTSGASSYDVYRGTTKLENTSSTSYTDNSAPTSSTQYKVYAINSCGSSSAGTDNGYRNAAPNTPSSVSATDKTYCDKVVITWNAASRATSYDVYRGSTKLGNTSSTSYTDSNAPSSSTQYKVYAVNSCGSSSAGTDNGYTDSTPSGTPVVNATDGTYCDKVVISWGSVNSATSYDVYRGSTKLGNTTGTSYTDNSAPSSATQYKVFANNKCGSSSAGTDNGYRNTAPAIPGGVNASDGTYCDKVVISWSTASRATSYDVYRGSTKLGNTLSTSYTDVSAPTLSTQYEVYAINSCGSSSAGNDNGYKDSAPETPGNVNATDGTYCDKVVITWNTASGASSYDVYRGSTLLGNTSLTTYSDNSPNPTSTEYKVVAKNGCGSSSAETDDGYRDSKPDTPAGVSASDGTYCERVEITWNAANGATGYDIYRGNIKLGSVNNTSFSDVNAPSLAAVYKVYATNTCGSSAAGTDEGRTDAPPAMPSEVVASDASYCDRVEISWGSVSGADEYEVFRNGSLLTTVTTQSYSDYDASTAESTYGIKALNRCGSSGEATDKGSLISPSISVDQGSVELSYNQNENASIQLEVVCTDWNISGTPEWLSLSESEGVAGSTDLTLTTLSDNLDFEARSATLSISGSGQETSLEVIQKPEPQIRLSALEFEVAPEGKELTVDVDANILWEASCEASWIHISPASSKGIVQVSITIDVNEELEKRSATVLVSGTDVQKEIRINQLASDIIKLSATTLYLNAELNSQTALTITSNINWAVDELVSWLEVSPTSDSGTIQVILKVTEENTNTDSRSTNVKIGGSGIEAMVEVVQMGTAPVLYVSDSIIILEPLTGADDTLHIASNTDWTIGGIPAWLLVDPAAGSMESEVVLTTLSDNYSGELWVDTLTIRAGSAISRVIVKQDFLIGMDNTEEITYLLYPNPTKNQLWLEFDRTYPDIVTTLMDMKGAVIAVNEHNFTDKVEIKLESLPDGMYFIRINIKDQTVLGKFIKAN